MRKLAFMATGVALLVGATFQGAKASPEDQLLNAYDALFNDLEALKNGKFGLTRMPSPFEHGQLGIIVGSKTDRATNDKFQRAVLELRDTIRKTSFLEDGFIPYIKRDRGPADLWWSDRENGKEKLFGHLSNQRESEKLGEDLRAVIAKDPKAIINRKIDGWIIKARAVFYRHKECLDCHKTAKVGDPAAIVAIAMKKRI
ncbi:MAG: hypothetical protein ABL962_12215 [Fimbriimonadaceae bacterium]